MFGSPLDPEHPFDTIPVMGRTRVRGRRAILVLAAGVVIGLWAGPLARAVGPTEPVPVAEHRVTVRSGDTLWAIAQRVAPGEDPRSVVDALVEANDVDPGALVPGQTLIIPGA